MAVAGMKTAAALLEGCGPFVPATAGGRPTES
jgi:hypothetical protein